MTTATCAILLITALLLCVIFGVNSKEMDDRMFANRLKKKHPGQSFDELYRKEKIELTESDYSLLEQIIATLEIKWSEAFTVPFWRNVAVVFTVLILITMFSQSS